MTFYDCVDGLRRREDPAKTVRETVGSLVKKSDLNITPAGTASLTFIDDRPTVLAPA